MELFLIQS